MRASRRRRQAYITTIYALPPYVISTIMVLACVPNVCTTNILAHTQLCAGAFAQLKVFSGPIYGRRTLARFSYRICNAIQMASIEYVVCVRIVHSNMRFGGIMMNEWSF